MIAAKPASLNFLEAASAPVVAVTAMQMLFDYAHLVSGQKVLIHGGAGNVGAYAVQLARNARLRVTATASTADLENVKALGATQVIDRNARFENIAGSFDAVIDTVGGETRERSFQVLKPGGILVSVASPVSEETAKSHGVRAVFFLVEVTTARLQKLAALFDSGKLVAHVGSVLPLQEARTAHQMLAGAPHKPGKILLTTAA
jgi:NADPH:quinone reductase-like Zn-dependent oxidoreductase